MKEKFQQQEKREDLDIEKYLDIILTRGELSKRPNPENFGDVWDKEKIEQDTLYVEKMHSKFEENDDVIEKKGKALEILAAYYIENMEWLGKRAHAVRTSEYDDIAHGIDLVAEFESEDEEIERLGIAIDAYSGKSISNLNKKAESFIKAVKGEINPVNGKPFMDNVAKVDYFESRIKDKEGKKYRGNLSKLPPVAVALSGFNASEFFKFTADVMSAENVVGTLQYRKQKDDNLTPMEVEMLEKNMEKLRKLRETIKEHPAQQLFIKQIAKQLEIYIEVGANSENSDSEFLQNIQSAYTIIEQLDNKETELGDLQEDLDKVEKIFENLK